MNMFKTFNLDLGVTAQYARVTFYEKQIANAQEYEREAIKFAAIAEDAGEGTHTYKVFMKRAEEAYLQGSRYYRAAQKHIKGK